MIGNARAIGALRCQGHSPAQGPYTMLLTIAVILAVLWLLGVFAFHVAGGIIHLVLVVAVIALVLHFVRGRGAV